MAVEKELYHLLINNPEEGIGKIMDQYIGYVYTIVFRKFRNKPHDIPIDGFPEHLSFKMIPCSDYKDIKQIGPSDVHNGISITTVTNKTEDQLIVWCYPLRESNATKDTILRYGQPKTSAFEISRYIKTEEGQIFSSNEGWQLNNRIIFDMPETFEDATLHIPYLAMMRSEKDKLKINLPNDYTTQESDVFVQCSLGTIRLTEVRREENLYESGKDLVWLKFVLDSDDMSKRMYSFEVETYGEFRSSARHYSPGDGSLEYILLDVDKNTSELTLEITDLHYYLFGEYVIPLELP